MNKIEILQKLINVSNNIVVMTGAGFSKASGIPDFRSADGLYNDKNKSMISPEEILSHHYFMAHPKAFYDFYFDKLGILSTYAYIKNSNIKSHNYVKSLGYKQDESKNNGEFYYYTLNKDDYIAKRYRYLSIT